MQIDDQTLKDLEFETIRLWLLQFARGETAKSRIEKLRPLPKTSEIKYQLDKTDELLQIRLIKESFPALDFEELVDEIKLLPKKNASIQLEGFMKIHQASHLINSILYFFDKREKEFPLLYESLSDVYYTKELIEKIEKVFDPNGKVKDEASITLSEIRSEIKLLRKKINQNFERELKKLIKNNVLGDTRESFISERRVLTVLSSHKRAVPGSILGSSNSGSYTYIEPNSTVALNNELELLIDDERKEIFKILQLLKADLLDHFDLIVGYQAVLTEFDFINSKMRLAFLLNCTKPSITEELELELIDAYHPILWKKNQDSKKKTFPQHVQMDKFSRMLVISGPNAGGKSITLKTIGMLQVMLQSGLLVPVNGNSKMCIFDNITSDIGDNQSISDELSTYSYRLKRMKYFLEIANKKTLLLIDEFGTGSDPDLGGALAEAIFEALYNKKCYGVITTHYSNIKLKANQLKNARNGCMLFNTETLEPLYKFSTGQPGSSFTFEVATINGIPEEIISQAKEKLDQKKVEMDKLLSDLQKEKSYLTRLTKEHISSQELTQEIQSDFEDKKSAFTVKLEQLKKSTIDNERFIQLGKKTSAFISRYNGRSRKKTINDSLLEDVRKYLAVEKSKIDEVQIIQKTKAAIKHAPKPLSKKQKKITKPVSDNHNREKIKVGSQVKLITTKQAGIVEEIKGDQLTVTFGFLRMKVELGKLTWIQD